MSIEAMKQALEALEYIHTETTEDEDELIHAAIIALRIAIAAAEKQEAAERYIHEYRSKPHPGDFGIPRGHWWQAKQYADVLYTTPPAAQSQWVGLTDEEIDEWTPEIYSVIQAIEAKLKEKNT